MSPTEIPLAAVASPLHRESAVREVVEEIAETLNRECGPRFKIVWDGRVVTDACGAREFAERVAKASPPAAVVAVATGGSESLIVEIAGLLGTGYPILVAAHKRMNSLAAAVEAYSRLRAEGFRAVDVVLTGTASGSGALPTLRAAAARNALKGMKLLILGGYSEWLVHSAVSGESLMLDMGVIAERVPLDELLKTFESVGCDDVAHLLKRFEGVERVGVSEEALVRALRLYVALKKLLNARKADAVTVRCFDLLPHGLTACLPLSMLNDEGIVAACEGDVPAALTMALLKEVSGEPAFMGNVAWVSSVDGTALLTHCTAPTKPFLGGFRLRTHYESGVGVAVEALPAGGEEVTIARLDGRLKTIVAGVGEVVNRGPITGEACRTQILVRLERPLTLIKAGVGNHYALVRGSWLEELKRFARMTGYGLIKV